MKPGASAPPLLDAAFAALQRELEAGRAANARMEASLRRIEAALARLGALHLGDPTSPAPDRRPVIQ
jgi:hypothetical protein